MMKALETQEARQEFATRLVKEVELGLSAVAWKFFQDQGRGYLCVEPRIDGLETLVEKVVYFSIRNPVPNVGDRHNALVRAVATYNPTAEFVIVIRFKALTGHEDEYGFTYQPDIDPATAFAAAEQRPSEFGIVWEI